jgi:hypothetical protein
VITARDEHERLQLEEADAWLEYLHAIRETKTSGAEYSDVEPWAWAQLQAKRRAIGTRRRKLERQAAAA